MSSSLVGSTTRPLNMYRFSRFSKSSCNTKITLTIISAYYLKTVIYIITSECGDPYRLWIWIYMFCLFTVTLQNGRTVHLDINLFFIHWSRFDLALMSQKKLHNGHKVMQLLDIECILSATCTSVQNKTFETACWQMSGLLEQLYTWL